MTTTHGRALLLCIKFLWHGKMAAIKSVKVYNFGEIERIISEATPTNTTGAPACGVL
mgnify:CR=1 FL=1